DVLHPLTGASTDYDPLIEEIADARYVLLGEATHGTHEFYKARAEISKRLIKEKGFTVIAWEADWPDAMRVNRFIRASASGQPASAGRRKIDDGDEAQKQKNLQSGSKDQSAMEALGDFQRFPQWMWRNADVL